MKFEYLHTSDRDKHLSRLVHPIFIEDIHKNLKNCANFIKFINMNKGVKTWFIFSDYCLDDKEKPNNVMTFTILALKNQSEFNLIGKVINALQKTDIKKTKIINPQFLEFISGLPIFNISFILPDKSNFIKPYLIDEIEFFKIRFKSLENFYSRMLAFPVQEKHYIDCIKDFQYIQKKFESKSISLYLYRNIEILNSVVSTIFTIISSVDPNTDYNLTWVSDRDSMLTFEKSNLSAPLIFSMISASFYSLSKSNNQLAFYDHKSVGTPELDHFNRIPDMITGTLADMGKTTVSKEKFLTVLKLYLVNQRQNHIVKFHFESDKYGLNTLILSKK